MCHFGVPKGPFLFGTYIIAFLNLIIISLKNKKINVISSAHPTIHVNNFKNIIEMCINSSAHPTIYTHFVSIIIIYIISKQYAATDLKFRHATMALQFHRVIQSALIKAVI